MTQDLQDRLLSWIELDRKRVIKLSELPQIDPAVKEYYRGVLIAYLDVIAFITSDGMLNQSTSSSRT